jgi:TM2 domain-containing membrane protein YozV
LPSTTPPYSASPTSFPTFTGYAPAPYVPAAYPFAGYYPPRKNRVAFVLMAVFLGPFGGHNFYAGYTNKAIIQLCITVLSCFFGAIVSWIWAIVEACVVDCDSDGVAFV